MNKTKYESLCSSILLKSHASSLHSAKQLAMQGNWQWGEHAASIKSSGMERHMLWQILLIQCLPFPFSLSQGAPGTPIPLEGMLSLNQQLTPRQSSTQIQPKLGAGQLWISHRFLPLPAFDALCSPQWSRHSRLVHNARSPTNSLKDYGVTEIHPILRFLVID